MSSLPATSGLSLVSEEEIPDRLVVTRAAATMQIRRPLWTWEDRVPAGAITLLGGREGIGKSTIAIDLAAKVTTGSLPGAYHGRPQNVMIAATEDDWSTVILPRLAAAGADLERIFAVAVQLSDGGTDSLTVPRDLVQLGEECVAKGITMLVVDPIMSIIDGKLDTHKDRETRRALDPLSRFAARNAITVIGLIHVNKSGSKDPLDSLMASKAFTAVARSVMYCHIDPDSEDESQYLFGHVKCNLGPKQPTIKYKIATALIDLEDDEPPVRTSRSVWGEQDNRSIRDVMETARETNLGDVSAQIIELLRINGTMTIEDICGVLTDASPSSIRQNLSRLARKNMIDKVSRGIYASLPAATDSEGDSGCDTTCDTPEPVTSVTSVTTTTTSDTHNQLALAGIMPVVTLVTGKQEREGVTTRSVTTCQVCHNPMTKLNDNQTTHPTCGP